MTWSPNRKRLHPLDKWGYRIVDFTKTEVNVEVYIPSDALVGCFSLTIENDDGVIYLHDAKVVILFNPWCRGKDGSKLVLKALRVTLE